MGQTYHALWVHLVWGTKHRLPLIVPTLRYKLYDQLRVIAKEKGYYLDFINGVEDHVHLLMGLHPKFALANVVKDLKGISSTWVRDNHLSEEYFHWQDGYAAISVSPDRVPVVRGYIKKQEEHHRKETWEAEWDEFKVQAIIYPD
jgi:putative transposase